MRKLRILLISMGATFAGVFLSVCGGRPASGPAARLDATPAKYVWAWKRDEDLRFLDPKVYGVAFLADTIFLKKDQVEPRRRLEKLDVPEPAYLVAVTRIETGKPTADRPDLSDEMLAETAALIVSTLDLKGVKAVQIDFDAVVSERDFYARLIRRVRSEMDSRPQGSDIPLTITSLASWCTGDAWFDGLPIDEAVPMVFGMGADEEKIRTYLRNGNDWREPLCRGSYGLSLEEGRFEGMKEGRRMYYFKDSSWKSVDLSAVR